MGAYYARELVSDSLALRRPGEEKRRSEPRPDGTVVWRDEQGGIVERQFPVDVLDGFLKMPGAKRMYRVLIKDPMLEDIREDYWELTEEQIANLLDSEETAYCIVVYANAERRQLLVPKLLWESAPGWPTCAGS